MGLLDSWGAMPDEQKGALMQGLLAAGFGAMAGRGTTMQAMGQGGMAGLLGYNHALGQYQDRAQQAQAATLRNQQIEQGRLNIDELKRQREVADGIRQAAQSSYTAPQLDNTSPEGPVMPTPGKFDTASFLDRMAQIDPLNAFELRQTLVKDTPFGKVDPKDYTPESIARFSMTRNFADLQPRTKMEVVNGVAVNPYQLAPGQVLPQDPNQPFQIGPDGRTPVPNTPFQQYRERVAAAGAARNSQTTVLKQEGKEAETVGKFFGDAYANIQTAGFNASSKIAKLDRLDKLLAGGVNTGKFAPALKEIAGAAESLGIKIDPNLGAAQAFEAIANEMALAARDPSSGAGMPGAMSDADRRFLTDTVPGLTKTREGNRLIIEATRRLVKRDQDVARLARDYRKKRGAIDEGFYDVLADFSARTPLFDGLGAPTASAQAPKGAPRVLRFDAQGNLIQE